MRTLVLAAALVAAAATAHAAPPKLTAVHCTLDGPALRVGEVSDGLAIAPDGGVLVIDADGDLRRYVVAKGKGCALQLDPSFGADGLLSLGVDPDFHFARVDVDRAGTIYATVGGRVQRIAHGKRAPMCGDGMVAATARSERLWRWSAISKITRESGACAEEGSLDASKGDAFVGMVWAVGDGLAVMRDAGPTLVYDGDGQPAGELADAGNLVRVERCGRAICAAEYEAIEVWGADGARSIDADVGDLLGTHRSWFVHGFAARGGSAYVLGLEYAEDAPDGKPVIVRVGGLPR